MAKKRSKEVSIRSSAAEYLTFVAATGGSNESVEVRHEDENIWITQKMLAVLYEVETNTINYHIKKIFEDSELEEDSVIRNFRITATDGKSYDTKHYNLQMIIAVGFKVNSERAVQFRKWVDNIAKEYTIKGFAMDDERLKNDGSILTKKYFEEQLERIREIRSSERKFYQKITDIYATAIDYDRDAAATKRFYATVQNMQGKQVRSVAHYAVHGHTAAELIVERTDAAKEHMGLTTWQDAPIRIKFSPEHTHILHIFRPFFNKKVHIFRSFFVSICTFLGSKQFFILLHFLRCPLIYNKKKCWKKDPVALLATVGVV